MRATVTALLLLSFFFVSQSHAAPPIGNVSSCPPQANGSVIYPNTNCKLIDSGGLVWSFNNTNCCLTANGTDQGTADAFGIGNCGGQCADFTGFKEKAIKEPYNGADPYFYIWNRQYP